MTWCEFLDFMRSVQGLTVAVFGIGLSYLVELWPAFEGLGERAKRYVIMAICVGLPVAALGLQWATKCVPGIDGEAVWQAVAAGFVAFGASQFAHSRKLE